MRILYLTYDGILEPLGQSQVLSYLEKLAKDHPIYLISFEKKIDRKNKILVKQTLHKMQTANISWHPLTYHKKFSILATGLDILLGITLGFLIAKSKKIQVVHSRSYVPSIIGLFIKKLTSIPFVFDMRGFWVDERVDGGLWNRDSSIYKVGKWFEKKFILNADHIVSLTKSGIRELKNFSYIEKNKINYSVIPTCADLTHFKNTEIDRKEFTVGYIGSVGVWYEFDAVIKAFEEILLINSRAKLLIVNRGDHNYIYEKIKLSNIVTGQYKIVSSSFENMPNLISQMHMAIFFIKPLFSKKASAPTRLAELLGCGIPCLSNEGIGDMTDLLEQNKVGVTIKDFSLSSIKIGINRFLPLLNDKTISQRARKVSKENFSLDLGVEAYNKIYQSFR